MALYYEFYDEDISFDDDPVQTLIANRRNDETVSFDDDPTQTLIANKMNDESVNLVDEQVGTAIKPRALDESLLLDPEEDDDLVWYRLLDEAIYFPVSFPVYTEFESYVELNNYLDEAIELDPEEGPNPIQYDELDEDVLLDADEDGVRLLDAENDETVSLDAQEAQEATIAAHLLEGYYRVENEDLDRYEAYVGVDEMPDLTDDPVNSPPDATFPGPSGVVALTWDALNYVVVSKRDRSGLRDGGNDAKLYDLDASGNLRTSPVSGPTNVVIRGAEGGNVVIEAEYNPAPDEPNEADNWNIFLTDDGSDPIVEPPPGWDLYGSGGMDDPTSNPQPIKVLSFTTIGPVPPGGGGWPTGTIIKAVVATWDSSRGWQSSAYSEILTFTINADGIDVQSGGASNE